MRFENDKGMPIRISERNAQQFSIMLVLFSLLVVQIDEVYNDFQRFCDIVMTISILETIAIPLYLPFAYLFNFLVCAKFAHMMLYSHLHC